jgi:2-polyprenyl-3-methyl-5-hydroxy-6-metoxy-1,4-benzoquinol methylase
MSDIRSLVDQADWNGQYDHRQLPADVNLYQFTHDIAIWRKLLPRLLPETPGGKVIEIGSAPGKFVLRLAELTQANAYGVEYTQSGAALNRATFAHYGANPEHVLHADFFSDAFLTAHRNQYDCVLSMGFVEHYDDPRPVISRHVDLVRPGGHVVISIPNYAGFNGLFAAIFDPSIPETHNMTIMSKAAYAALFDDPRLKMQFVGHIGRFHFSFRNEAHGWRRALQMLIMNLQPAIAWLLKRLPWSWNLDGPLFSPYLIYVGQRVR